MELTDALLSALEVVVEPFAVCDVRGGQYLDLEPDASNSIHYVLSGSGRLLSAGYAAIDLQVDQMVLIPKGLSHRIESRQIEELSENKASLCLQPSESLTWLQSGDGGTDIVLACGRIHATYGQDIDIFDLLDQPLLQSFESSEYIRGSFQAMLREFCEPQLGTMALTSSLMKQCLIMLLRQLQQQQDRRIPWLAVLDSPGLQKALKAIFNTPEKNLRVEELADLAHMSRSAFSEHFAKVLGLPPHEFLANYRLKRAALLLQTTNLPVNSIADQVGYKSRSSFSRAFKSVYQVDPATYRRATHPN